MKRLYNILKPSPFKIGIVIVLIANFIYWDFGNHKPAIFKSIDNYITNVMFKYRGKANPTGSVIIVDIDEESLNKIGQWPWPRTIVADLVNKIHEGGVKVLGFDIVFAEKDRSSPLLYLDKLQEVLKLDIPPDELEKMKHSDALNNDLILGDAVYAGPSVLGYIFQEKHDTLKTGLDKPFPSINIRIQPSNFGFEDLQLMKAYRPILNVVDVAQAETEGFFNVFPDQTGTVRQVPLFMELDNIAYPSLALEMLRLGLKEKNVTINLSSQVKQGKQDMIGVFLGDRFVPTNHTGQVTVNYRGPYFTFEYISALDILEGKTLSRLQEKYAIIGTSAAGLLDLRATPFSSKYPGVEIHATVIDNILAGDLFTYDYFTEFALTITLLTLFGILLSAILAYSGPVYGGIGGLFFILAVVAGNYHFFFLKNEIFGVSYLLLVIFIIFLIVTLSNYFFEGKEKMFINNAFGRYVSPHVVSQLVRSPEKLSLTGDQKVLTIFFSDIRDFTTISEKMNSKDLAKLLNEYLTAMSDIVMEHDGLVDKFIGDAVMSIWGAPLEDEQHAVKSVRASLKMMETLKQLQAGWEIRGFPLIDIGIGVNTGIVSVGNFGSDRRFDYTVIGDNVNLASRLEGLNKMYGTNIIISEYTKDAVGDGFSVRELDTVKVKGKVKPVSIYELICEGDLPQEMRDEVSIFNEILLDYRLRKFEKAYEDLKKINATHPSKLYTLYMSRIESYLKDPPPEDWDGAFVFRRK